MIALKAEIENARRGEPTDADFEIFLTDEELGLLAAYRSIREETVRVGVRTLLEAQAVSDARAPSASD